MRDALKATLLDLAILSIGLALLPIGLYMAVSVDTLAEQLTAGILLVSGLSIIALGIAGGG